MQLPLESAGCCVATVQGNMRPLLLVCWQPIWQRSPAKLWKEKAGAIAADSGAGASATAADLSAEVSGPAHPHTPGLWRTLFVQEHACRVEEISRYINSRLNTYICPMRALLHHSLLLQ